MPKARPHRLYIIFTLLLFAVHFCEAQKNTADSLRGVIANSKNQKDQLKAFTDLTNYYSLKDFDSSKFFAETGMKLAIQLKDSLSWAGLISSLGEAEYFRGDYQKAATCFYTAIPVLERRNDKNKLPITLGAIAKLFRKTGEFDKALKYYDEALAIYVRANDSGGIQIMLNESGVAYLFKGDYDEALKRYFKALSINSARNDSVGMAYSLSFIAEIYVIQKKYAEAEQTLLKCLAIREQMRDSFAIGLAHSDLGNMYAAANQTVKAFEQFNLAVKFAKDFNYPEFLSNNYQCMADLAEKTGDYKNALAYSRLSTKINDSLFNIEKTKKIEELNTKYQTGKKEQQILLQNAKISRKNYLIGGISAVFVLAMLLAVSLYRRYQLKQEAKLQQTILTQQDMATKAILEAEENERQRIARDLHDGVGQMMSAVKMNLTSFEKEMNVTDTMAMDKYQSIIDMVDESCKEVRAVSHNMMPNALIKTGLVSAVREFLNKINQGAIEVNMYSDGLDTQMDKNTEIVLYRVIQEAVNNVIKHAAATKLDISIIKDENMITTTIEDNGKGFDMAQAGFTEGIGIKNIRARVAFLKGSIHFDSSPGKGTVIVIEVAV